MVIRDVGSLSSSIDNINNTSIPNSKVNNLKNNNLDSKGDANNIDKSIDPDKVVDILKNKLDKVKKIFNSDAKFEIDKDADMIIVKIIDKDSKEVVRQIPPEVSVKLAKALSDVEGILFDEKA